MPRTNHSPAFALLAALYLALFLHLPLLASSTPCTQLPRCTRVNQPCLTSNFTAARACARSIEPRADWHRSTIAALMTGLDNYGFRQLVRRSGPPYNVAIDVVAALNATLAKSYAAEIDFHEDVQTALTALHDAHTSYYIKPLCFGRATLLSPFVFEVALVDAQGVMVTLAPSASFDVYTKVFPDRAAAMRAALTRKVALIDGLETLTALSAWGDADVGASNDASARFNDAVRSFLYRPLSEQHWPRDDAIVLTLDNVAAGEQLVVPWLVGYRAGFGDADQCVPEAARQPLARAAKSPAPRPTPLPRRRHRNLQSLSQRFRARLGDTPSRSARLSPLAFTSSAAALSRQVIVPPGATLSGIACFVQSTDSNSGSGEARRTLVLVVPTFDLNPDSPDYVEFFQAAAKCLSAVGPRDAVVVDVQSNGGGLVEAGYALLAMIYPRFAPDSAAISGVPASMYYLYDLPQGAAIAALAARDSKCDLCDLDPATLRSPPNGTWLFDPPVAWVQGGVRGLHSKQFVLNNSDAIAMLATLDYPKPTVADRARVTILTDGLCGSTCCQFATLALEANAATFVGVGGLWGEPIDVASFCGGYVNNLDNLAAELADFNVTSVDVPQFETTASWQWDQAVMYSRVQPSLPMQFVPVPADVRVPFWAFPHPSVPRATSDQQLSLLWDAVVAGAVERYAPSSSAAGPDAGVAAGYRTATFALGAGLALAAVVAAGWCVTKARRSARDSPLLSGGDDVVVEPAANVVAARSDASHYVVMGSGDRA
jgi:hypothetical protein